MSVPPRTAVYLKGEDVLTGDFIGDMAPFLTWLVALYKDFGVLLGLTAGFFGLMTFASFKSEKNSGEWYLIPFFLSVVVFLSVQFVMPYVLRERIGDVSVSYIYAFFWLIGMGLGVFLSLFYLRVGEPKLVAIRERFTKRSEEQRDKKTDVRTVKSLLPKTPEIYDVMKYYEAGFITVGLDKDEKPVRVSFDDWCSNHIQLSGTTGSGKGVAAQVALSQAALQGEAIFVFDPKNDEWMPHVLYEVTKKANLPYIFIDLRDGNKAQINPFLNASKADIQEMLFAAFSLGEKGSDADFYRLNDRRAARAAAKMISNKTTPTFNNVLQELIELDEVKDAAGFIGAFEEMAELESINAENGIDIGKVIEGGGVVYIVGSMRNSPVIKAQRMMMIRLTQLCEQRERFEKQRSVCAFLDELKYHLSKPALEIFGAARDKGLHAIVAHQALSDLRDVPADLDAEAVVGSVIENTAIKIIYKLQDPDTAEWIAKRSGIKLVDEDIRSIDSNIVHSEILKEERQIRQGETFLVDTNMLMNLPKRVAVLFSEELPQFIGTSPIVVEKKQQAIATNTEKTETLQKDEKEPDIVTFDIFDGVKK